MWRDSTWGEGWETTAPVWLHFHHCVTLRPSYSSVEIGVMPPPTIREAFPVGVPSLGLPLWTLR